MSSIGCGNGQVDGMETLSLNQIIEYALSILEMFQPVFWLLAGLLLINLLLRIFIILKPDKVTIRKPEEISHTPAWVYKEEEHRSRTQRYANRIHHHRARGSKCTSSKSY